MPEEDKLPTIECCPQAGLPPGLGETARAYAIIAQANMREEIENREKRDAAWLAKPFRPRIDIKIVGVKGVGLTLGDVLDIPA